MKQRRIAIVMAIVAVSLVTGAWLLQRQGAAPATVYQQARAFDDVLAHVADFYVDSIDEGKLYQMAIDGLLDQLHDPYSTFLKPDDFRALNEQTSGNYGGLGLQIDVRDNWITVVAPLPDSPAERAGIQSGDLIIGLDGRSTEGWKNDQAVKELRGVPGTQAELKVRRAGVDQAITYKLTRATIHLRSVQLAMMLDDHVGYIALSPVSETSAQEMQAAVDSLMKVGMKSLIFDMRGNPGGLLNQGIKVSELFLDPGQVVVATRGRAPDANRIDRDNDKQIWPGLPIVTLVNGGTASAAEIIAGALQDHDRSLVIGTPTFGKGLVQSLYPFTRDPPTALKLTTARWYTPSGRTIQRKSKSEEDQEAQVAAASTSAGQDTGKVDSTLVFHTDMGRTVLGGGGIRPDIFVAADTFTTAERNYMKTLGSKIPVFRDVLSTYALELKAGHMVSSPNFTVTPAMVNEVVNRLRAKGTAVPDSVTSGARGLIAEELGYETARYVFGRSVEFRRRMGDDSQVKEAMRFARQAKSPADLLASATAQSSSRSPK